MDIIIGISRASNSCTTNNHTTFTHPHSYRYCTAPQTIMILDRSGHVRYKGVATPRRGSITRWHELMVRAYDKKIIGDHTCDARAVYKW